MPTLHTSSAENTTPIGTPDTGARSSIASTTCFQVPWASRPQHASISASEAKRHTRCPATGRRSIRLDMPRWALSCIATSAPSRVSHMKRKRDTSSENTMPELKP